MSISAQGHENLYSTTYQFPSVLPRLIAFQPAGCSPGRGTASFPGIPLAILFPQSRFHLVDSIGKKITVVKNVAESLGLTNVSAEQARAEQLKGEYDFIVSRAVTRLKEFYSWVHRKSKKKSTHELYNGILYLKGGDLDEELAELKKPYQLFSLSDSFKEEYFETKKIVYIPL